MSLRNVSTPAMISLSGAWLDPEGARPQIAAIPAAAALLPLIDKGHKSLLKTQAKPRVVSDKLVEIQGKQADLDKTHDRKGRGLYLTLTGFADLVDDPELATDMLALRDKIFDPETGLRVLQVSYAEEAGEVALLEERLDDEDRALLKKLGYPEGKLLDAHKARVSAGKKLGDLEKEKNTLANEESHDATTTMPADVLRARNVWIQGARALVQVLDLAEVDAKTRSHILAPLAEAERKADLRASKSGGSQPAEDDSAAPAAPDANPADPKSPPK